MPVGAGAQADAGFFAARMTIWRKERHARQAVGLDAEATALREIAGEKVFARGAAYHDGKQVEIVAIDRTGVVAKVQRTAPTATLYFFLIPQA